MNSQERDALSIFLQQLTQAPAPQKEPEAEAMIAKAMAAQPNAGYLLVQRAMQLDYVLQQSQAKVAELQAELDRSKAGAQTSFLGDAHAWGRGPATTSAAVNTAPNSGVRPASPQMQSVSPVAPAPAPAPATPAPWGSSVMGSVATTAAGVVAGSFLFQGIQNLMGNHNPGGGFGGSGFGNNAGFTPPAPVTVNETTVNNYYTNDPATDQSFTSGGTSYADASDSFESEDFGSDDSDFA